MRPNKCDKCEIVLGCRNQEGRRGKSIIQQDHEREQEQEEKVKGKMKGYRSGNSDLCILKGPSDLLHRESPIPPHAVDKGIPEPPALNKEAGQAPGCQAGQGYLHMCTIAEAKAANLAIAPRLADNPFDRVVPIFPFVNVLTEGAFGFVPAPDHLVSCQF